MPSSKGLHSYNCIEDMNSYFTHPTALVETEKIGNGSRIWAFTHILQGAVIGRNCNIGDHCFIESGVKIGDNVTIKNNTTIWEGITIEQNVFIGPNAVFTNDPMPRSPRLPLVVERYKTKEWLRETIIREGASIGANAIILCGLEIGQYAMIGAGTIVTKSVPPYALVYGNPGQIKGYVCQCGEKLNITGEQAICHRCGSEYINKSDSVMYKE